MGLQKLLLYGAVPIAGNPPVAELSQIGAVVADKPTVKDN